VSPHQLGSGFWPNSGSGSSTRGGLLGSGPRTRLTSQDSDPIAETGTAEEVCMPDNVYKVIELIGTSDESWEKAAKAAVERAGVRISR
jgi:hypothetical protein